MLCRPGPDQIDAIVNAFGKTKLDELQKDSLQKRYKFLLQGYKGRAHRYNYAYHGLRITVTIGSLIVPALLSVQNTGPLSEQIYWFVWVLSLLVTISNGISTLLKVDKKYFTLNTTYQLLLSEGWQFIELSGRFSGFYTPGQDATHINQYKFFCHFLEKVRMKQVEDEYYKAPDQGQQATTHPTDSLVPPTPQKGLAPLKSQPDVNASATTIRRQHSAPAGFNKEAQSSAASEASTTSVTAFGTASAAASAAAPVLPAIAESDREGWNSE